MYTHLDLTFCVLSVKLFISVIVSFHSEAAAKVMVELLGSYTEDNASQARVDAHR